MPYDRDKAVQYAATWWNGFNPRFRNMQGDDCTNFISQCLLAGGWSMETTGDRSRGWWYQGPAEQWSFSWAVSNALRWYLQGSGRADTRESARELEIGDVIIYDWNGDGTGEHVTIVVGYDYDGEPLVAAHTVASWERPWSYRSSPSYSPRTRYMFWHINS